MPDRAIVAFDVGVLLRLARSSASRSAMKSMDRVTFGLWGTASCLSRMLARKPKMLVAIALANKMARQIWAMLTKHADYKDPELASLA